MCKTLRTTGLPQVGGVQWPHSAMGSIPIARATYFFSIHHL